MDLIATYHASGDANAVARCCTAANRDPIATMFCTLVERVMGKDADGSAFLAAVPRHRQGAADVWALDKIWTAVPAGPAWSDLTMAYGSLSDRYVAELFALVLKGNHAAAQRYMLLYSNAEGVAAGFMQDELATLFGDHPSRALELWPILRPYRMRLTGISEGLSEEASEQIAEKFLGLCGGGDRRCAEIRALFISH